MRQHRIPAVFMRGGTSKGLMLKRDDLPERERWDPIFLAALGSPDSYGRQLDGMGGGLSSLSKVCVIGAPTRKDADVDYTFAQVLIRDSHVDYNSLCGNMTSAVGPFAVDEGMVAATGDKATVRIHNTNTNKIIVANFLMEDGAAAVDGELVIPGVDGTGSPVRLDFLDPGGATTGTLLPTGRPTDRLDVEGMGSIEVSMIDASNACVFLRAETIGLRGTEMPPEIEGNAEVMRKLMAIRLAASVRMGIADSIETARKNTSVPMIGFVAPPTEATTLSGTKIPAEGVDLVARMLSNGQPHRALPLGASMCMAVAARIEGSVVHAVTRKPANPTDDLLISMPSGVLKVAVDVVSEGNQWRAVRGGFYRTQRRLFEGRLLVRGAAMS